MGNTQIFTNKINIAKGIKKVKKLSFSFLKSIKVLRRRFGKISLNLGKEIFLDDFTGDILDKDSLDKREKREIPLLLDYSLFSLFSNAPCYAKLTSMTFLNPTFIIAVLIGLSVHEWAHGYVAFKLGDPTAKMENRVSLNPLAHLDPIGTLMFFIIGFGWAKPVPIDPRYFKNVKRDTTLVSLAGPAANLATAFICFFLMLALFEWREGSSALQLMHVTGNGPAFLLFLERVLSQSIFVNLALMAFNLLPVNPLDGSKILYAFIPLKYEREYHEFMARGPMILLILIVAGIAFNIPILSTWVFGVMRPILALMGAIAGII